MTQIPPGKANILTFGIMCQGTDFQVWQARCIQLLLEHGLVCRLLIVDNQKSVRNSFFTKFRNYFHSDGLYRLYLRFLFRPNAKKNISLKYILSETPVINCITIKKKHSEYFGVADVAKIKSFGLDFILRFGFNIIRGEILEVARYGVWSFHHDDERKYRGGPPGFWEIMKNDHVTGVILQRLTNKLDGGIILRKGYFKTIKHSYRGQIDQLYFNAGSFPLQVCIDIKNGVAAYFEKGESSTVTKIFRVPSNSVMIVFLIKLFVNKMAFHFNELFRPEYWNCCLTENIQTNLTGFYQPKILTCLPTPPKGNYFADPFGFDDGDKLVILFENYNYRSRKGIISKIEYSGGRFGDVIPAIREDFHLSFPSIAEHNGEVYCIPETASTNNIRLYRYHHEKSVFVFHKILCDFPGVDPVVFQHDGYWWLFATHKNNSNCGLFLFWSTSFDGAYLPHANNPVKTDIRSSRPAGLPFYHNGNLIRPAQDSSVTYGGKVVFNKVTRLTPFEFEEEISGNIYPVLKSRFDKGLHTFNRVGEFTLVDAKCYRFNYHNFYYQIKKKIRVLGTNSGNK